MTHLSENMLNEYLDGALSLTAQKEADGHLATCPVCRAQLESLRSLFAELESLPELALERDLSSAVVLALGNRLSLPRPIRLAVFAQALTVLGIFALAWPLFELAILNLSLAMNVPPSDEFVRLLGVQWTAWEQAASQFSMLPAFDTSFSLDLDPPVVLLTLTILSASLLWLVGNSLLLKPRAGSYKRRQS